jgi:hypothetical protein
MTVQAHLSACLDFANFAYFSRHLDAILTPKSEHKKSPGVI